MFSMFYLGCNTILLCPLLCVTFGVCCYYVPICINILPSKKIMNLAMNIIAQCFCSYSLCLFYMDI
jgi:hypothetical protein